MFVQKLHYFLKFFIEDIAFKHTIVFSSALNTGQQLYLVIIKYIIIGDYSNNAGYRNRNSQINE